MLTGAISHLIWSGLDSKPALFCWRYSASQPASASEPRSAFKKRIYGKAKGDDERLCNLLLCLRAHVCVCVCVCHRQHGC